MKVLISTLLAVLTLTNLSQAQFQTGLSLSDPNKGPSISAPPVVFEDTFILDHGGVGLGSEKIGEIIIPPRPEPANEWQKFTVTYAISYSSWSYVCNETEEVVPASYQSSLQSSTLQLLFLQENPTTTVFPEAFPWYAVSAGYFPYPELQPGQRYEGFNVVPVAAYSHSVMFHDYNYPYVQSGAKVEIWARHGGNFWQFNNSGAHGTHWNAHIKVTVRWTKNLK